MEDNRDEPLRWPSGTYTSGSSTCTREETLHGCLGAGCGRRRPACDTYGLKAATVRDTWGTPPLWRLARCSWRRPTWRRPPPQTGLRCRCCWLGDTHTKKKDKTQIKNPQIPQTNLHLKFKCRKILKRKQQHQVVSFQIAASFTLSQFPVNYGGLRTQTWIPRPLSISLVYLKTSSHPNYKTGSSLKNMALTICIFWYTVYENQRMRDE